MLALTFYSTHPIANDAQICGYLYLYPHTTLITAKKYCEFSRFQNDLLHITNLAFSLFAAALTPAGMP